MTKHSSEPTMQHTLTSRKVAVAALGALAVVLAPEAAQAGMLGFPDQVTVWGHQVDFIYQLTTWISIGILAVVWIGLAAALIKFRKRANETREPETWSHNTKLEVIWTVIPFLLLIVILFPTFKALAYLADVPKKADLTVEVVGHQFFWEYRYPDLGIKFNTTPTMGPGTGMEELVLPVDRKIKMVFTSADVIHSWLVPQFGIQQMTTPGMLAMAPLEIKKAGLYEGYCTYLCGDLHGAMRIRVKAVPESEFTAWAAGYAKTPNIEPIAKVGKVGMVAPPPKKKEHGAEGEHGKAPADGHGETAAQVDPVKLSAMGKEIYASKCAGCHGAEGAGTPGVFPPVAGAEQVNGDDAALIGILLNGLQGPVTVKGQSYNGMMPPWKDQLNDEEVAAVATFMRTSWGNNGKAISPEQVKALR